MPAVPCSDNASSAPDMARRFKAPQKYVMDIPITKAKHERRQTGKHFIQKKHKRDVDLTDAEQKGCRSTNRKTGINKLCFISLN